MNDATGDKAAPPYPILRRVTLEIHGPDKTTCLSEADNWRRYIEMENCLAFVHDRSEWLSRLRQLRITYKVEVEHGR